MAVTLAAIVERFAALHVLVIGETMLDCYLHGSTGRLCREAPVPIVDVAHRQETPGGAGNTAVNVARLGARVTFVSVTGDDAEGAAVLRALDQAGIDVEGVFRQPGRRTLAKHRLLAGSQMLVRYDQGTTAAAPPEIEAALVRRLGALHAAHDVVLVSDYGYGVLTPGVIAALARAQRRAPRPLLVDSKTLPAFRRAGVTAVKPNWTEVLELIGHRIPPPRGERAAFLGHHGARLLEATGAQIAAVTLDTEGALFFERGRPVYRTYARPVEHQRATGAGDTFLAALGLALGAGADLAAAAELASAAAGVVVGKDATATCTAAELRAAVTPADKHVSDVASLVARLQLHRRAGHRVVLTNGCFDILHSGHIAYLSQAKALGDVLVVGLNSDAGVRRLKGPARPINGLADRAAVLAALSAVDHIVAFDEDSPVALVRAVRPDVFVKGGDYTLDRLPEAAVVRELGGVVRILPYVGDRSTTSIIERIARQTPRLENIA